MTPEEQAKELFNKFKPTIDSIDWWDKCKESASICADEVLTELLTLKTAFYIDGSQPYPIQHWVAVKEEIEKL